MDANSIKIAICGQLRAGKSTVSEHLVHNHGFQPVSFGAELKSHADKLFAFSDVYKSEPIVVDDEQFGGTRTIGKRKPRRLYQDFGEKMRELDPSIWIGHAAEKVRLIELIAAANGEQARIVIDDLRQPNEYDWARANGFTIVRVNAPDELRIERAKAAGDDFSIEDLRHPTEMYVQDFEVDFDIWNGVGVESVELERKIDAILSELAYDGNGDVFYSVK